MSQGQIVSGCSSYPRGTLTFIHRKWRWLQRNSAPCVSRDQAHNLKGLGQLPMSLPLLATWIQGSPPRMRGALTTLRDTGPSSKTSVSTGCLLHRLRPPSLFIGLCCKPHTRTPFFFFFFFLNNKPHPTTTYSSLESSGSPLLRSPRDPKLLACRFPAFRAHTASHIRHAVRPFTLAQYGRSQTPRPVSPSVISAQSNPDPLSGSRLGLPPHRNSEKAEACPLSTRPASTVSLTLVGSAHFLQSWGFSASIEGEGTLYEWSPFQPTIRHIAAFWKTISPSVKEE